MKNILKPALFAAAVCCAVAVSAKAPENVSSAVFTLQPQMTCVNCENKIKTNLRFEKGVKKIVTDRNKQTVTITYDTKKTDEAKLKAAFAKIGYKATIPQE